jgi:hypothetical protein
MKLQAASAKVIVSRPQRIHEVARSLSVLIRGLRNHLSLSFEGLLSL